MSVPMWLIVLWHSAFIVGAMAGLISAALVDFQAFRAFKSVSDFQDLRLGHGAVSMGPGLRGRRAQRDGLLERHRVGVNPEAGGGNSCGGPFSRRHYSVAFVGVGVNQACSASQKHIAVTVDATLFETLSDIHTLEQTTLCGQPSCAEVTARVTPGWDDDRSQGFNKRLLPIVDGGRQLNAQLALIKSGSGLTGNDRPDRKHQRLAHTVGARLSRRDHEDEDPAACRWS